MNRKILWGCLLVLALLISAAGGTAYADGNVFEISADTYSTYFNDDGTTKETIGENDHLVFKGELDGKRFILDRPMTVTADPDAPPCSTRRSESWRTTSASTG